MRGSRRVMLRTHQLCGSISKGLTVWRKYVDGGIWRTHTFLLHTHMPCRIGTGITVDKGGEPSYIAFL